MFFFPIPRIKKFFPLFFVVCLVMGSALFFGCDLGGDSGGYSLVGTWSSGTDGYEITDKTMTYNGYTGYGFKANIRDIIEFNASSGVIIVEYTTKPTAYTLPGNFQGVYYKELKQKSVKLGSAYTVADYTPVEVKTLQEAQAKFKQDTIALYGGELTMAVTQIRQ